MFNEMEKINGKNIDRESAKCILKKIMKILN
jgi:hypothetical protein